MLPVSLSTHRLLRRGWTTLFVFSLLSSRAWSGNGDVDVTKRETFATNLVHGGIVELVLTDAEGNVTPVRLDPAMSIGAALDEAEWQFGFRPDAGVCFEVRRAETNFTTDVALSTTNAIPIGDVQADPCGVVFVAIDPQLPSFALLEIQFIETRTFDYRMTIDLRPEFQGCGTIQDIEVSETIRARLKWKSMPGATYAIDSASMLQGWTEREADIVSVGMETEAEVVLAPGESSRQFRIRLVLPAP